MSAPSPFTSACDRLDQLVASTASLPTTRHSIATPADKLDFDPGYYATPDPIRIRQAETALVVALHEVRKRQPDLSAAADYARRAVMLIQAAGKVGA